MVARGRLGQALGVAAKPSQPSATATISHSSIRIGGFPTSFDPGASAAVSAKPAWNSARASSVAKT